jgi:AcrR family transcriptional regulator
VGEGDVTGAAARARLPRAEREQQMLAAARGLFAERGYGAVTMGDVAAAVGVTKPLLYTYFGNKERLYLACMEPAAQALQSEVASAVAAAERPADALELGVQAFFAYVDRDRDAWRVLFDETLPAGGEVARRVAEHRQQLEAVVARLVVARLPGRRRGRGAIEAEALSTALLGAAESLARWWLRTGALSAGQAAALLIETVEPGLRARATGRGR